jgi:hypothetical protein
MNDPVYKGPERRMNDERITRLEGRVDGHEILCAERYKNLENSIDNSKDAIDRIYKMLWGAVITVMLGLAGNFMATITRSPDPTKVVYHPGDPVNK